MACRLIGDKPLSAPMLEYCRLDSIGNKLQWNFNQNTYIYIQENVFENVVWKMAGILSRPQCVNTLILRSPIWVLTSLEERDVEQYVSHKIAHGA